VTADQRMLIRRCRDDLASFVHDVSNASFLRLLSGSVDLDHVRASGAVTDTATCPVDVNPGRAPGSAPPPLAQCHANAAGLSVTCVSNPYFANAQAPT
jgi:hypothetical protein